MSEPLSPEAFDALRAAVGIARDRQVQSVKTLRRHLAAEGHQERDIDAALSYWGDTLRRFGVRV